jgi:hypothetical protein
MHFLCGLQKEIISWDNIKTRSKLLIITSIYKPDQSNHTWKRFRKCKISSMWTLELWREEEKKVCFLDSPGGVFSLSGWARARASRDVLLVAGARGAAEWLTSAPVMEPLPKYRSLFSLFQRQQFPCSQFSTPAACVHRLFPIRSPAAQDGFRSGAKSAQPHIRRAPSQHHFLHDFSKISLKECVQFCYWDVFFVNLFCFVLCYIYFIFF